MLKLRRIAVTGGIASGKSTVAGIFQKLGAYVVSADQITHQFLAANTALSKQITALLGTGILSNGCIDRKKMASVVFQSPKLLHEVEQIIHPRIAREIKQQWTKAKASKKYSLFVAEMPLLFEAEQEGFYDATVAVVAEENAARMRFCDKTGYDDEEYRRRAQFQLTPAQKAAKATYVIENMGSLKELEAQVASLYQLLSNGEDA